MLDLNLPTRNLQFPVRRGKRETVHFSIANVAGKRHNIPVWRR
jgi:hypothetical protein